MSSPAVLHGIGLFETALVARGRVVQLAEHFRRMTASAIALGFPAPRPELFAEQMTRAAATVATAAEAAVRCLYLQSDAELWVLHATAMPVSPITLQRRARGRAVTLRLTRSLPAHKLTSYAACILGLRQAAAAGADEGLFTTEDGRILEGTATNVFALRDKTLITAAVADGILPGVVRAWTMGEAVRIGLTIEERPPAAAELREGGFLTGSLTMLAPLRLLDGSVCRPPGPVFEELAQAYRALAERDR